MLYMAAEEFSAIMAFAHSRESLFNYQIQHEGEWRGLNRLLNEIPEVKADRGLLEWAVLMRSVDDVDPLPDHGIDIGTLAKKDGQESPLNLRQVCNKVIHAVRYEWVFEDQADPRVICVAPEPENWLQARLRLNGLASYMGAFI